MKSDLRRPTTLDGLFVIAALAAAFALTRQTWTLDKVRWATNPIPPYTVGLLVSLSTSQVIAALMVALTATALRPPRPPLRRLARRPGFVAASAGAAALVMGGFQWLICFFYRYRWVEQNTMQLRWLDAEAYIAPAVIAAWSCQILLGRWRPEASIVDRAGRALGVGTVLLVVYRLVFSWIAPWFPSV